MTKEEFIEFTGEDPVDVFGEDWEAYVDSLLEEYGVDEDRIDPNFDNLDHVFY